MPGMSHGDADFVAKLYGLGPILSENLPPNRVSLCDVSGMMTSLPCDFIMSGTYAAMPPCPPFLESFLPPLTGATISLGNLSNP